MAASKLGFAEGLPDDPEVVSIEVPALDDALLVLEHDLREGVEVGRHDRGVEVLLGARGVVGDAPESEDAADLEVICELQGGVRFHKRDAVHRVTLLAVHLGG